jgi:hypothetical protein
MEGRDSKNLYGGRCAKMTRGDNKFCATHQKNRPNGVWNGDYEGPLREAIRKMSVEQKQKQKKSDKSSSKQHECAIDIEEEIKKEFLSEPNLNSESEYEEEEEEEEELMDPVKIDGKRYFMPKNSIKVYDADGTLIGHYDRDTKDWIEKFNLESDYESNEDSDSDSDEDSDEE